MCVRERERVRERGRRGREREMYNVRKMLVFPHTTCIITVKNFVCWFRGNVTIHVRIVYNFRVKGYMYLYILHHICFLRVHCKYMCIYVYIQIV